MELTLEIQSIAQGGAGVGRVEGMVVFAVGGLPGEVVRVELSERRPTYARGDVVEVLTPSPDRVVPLAPADGHAAWQHIAYPAQLRFKEMILREQLAKLAGLSDILIAPIIAAPHPWGYRNSAHLHVANGKIGYHTSGTRDVTELPEDPLLLPVLNDTLAGLRTINFDTQLLAGITLRASSAYGYAVATLQAAPKARLGDIAYLAAAWRAAVPALAGVAVQAEGFAQDPVSIRDELGGMLFVLGPDSFFQVNAAQAERMLAVVREQLALQPGERLLDLYSGAGAFALPLSPGLADVVAVEEYASAVYDGRRSADMNLLINLEFVHSPVERALHLLDGSFAAAVLDPPRRGCHPAVIAELARSGPPRMAYISCHPGILARDLGPLLEAGYQIDLLQPIDLFPQTPHIECVVMLSR